MKKILFLGLVGCFASDAAINAPQTTNNKFDGLSVKAGISYNNGKTKDNIANQSAIAVYQLRVKYTIVEEQKMGSALTPPVAASNFTEPLVIGLASTSVPVTLAGKSLSYSKQYLSGELAADWGKSVGKYLYVGAQAFFELSHQKMNIQKPSNNLLG